MKAIVTTAYGSPDVLQLQEVPAPTPGDKEVRVKIHAATVTSGDARIRRADPFLIRLIYGWKRPKTPILGNEFSGVIESVGDSVTQFKKGDRVFGATGFKLGANAEYVVLPESGMVALKPENLTFEEAAAIPFGATAALFFLREKGRIRPGQKVLVIGASGSLGTAAVQLARYFGAEVTGVTSAGNADLVKSLGADKVIDYTREDYTRNGERYDLIFDTVGKASFSASKRILHPKGLFLAAAAGFSALFLALLSALTGGPKLVMGVVEERREDLDFLKGLLESGHLKPVVDRRYAFEQTAEAHRYVDTGRKKGNVVITLAGE